MDLLIPFRLAKDCGLKRLNVVNKVMSTLAREENCGVFLNCGRELSVASTKAFMSQVTVLTLVSLWFAQCKRYKETKKMRAGLISELRFLSGNMEKTIEQSVDFAKHVSSKVLKGHDHIYLLGSGLAEIATKEGSLKIKELTYTHCQALNLGSNIANSFYSYMAAHIDTPMILTVLDTGNVESDL